MVSSLLARCIIVTIGTLYPGYRSYKSLINSDLRGVVNCLRYWIVFSIFIACETITDVLLSWFPFYYWIKIGVVLWMISPAGSTMIYKRFIHPVLKDKEQDIDQLIEQTKQKGYLTLLDLTQKGIRYASTMVLNSAVLGQAYLGEHLKRSLSTSDISNVPNKPFSNPPDTLFEEDEEESSDFSKRLKDNQKHLSKDNTATSRREYSQRQERSVDYVDQTTDEVKNAKKTSVRPRSGNKPSGTPYSTSESSHIGTISKRQQMMKMAEPTKKPAMKSVKPVKPEDITLDDIDDEQETVSLI